MATRTKEQHAEHAQDGNEQGEQTPHRADPRVVQARLGYAVSSLYTGRASTFGATRSP